MKRTLKARNVSVMALSWNRLMQTKEEDHQLYSSMVNVLAVLRCRTKFKCFFRMEFTLAVILVIIVELISPNTTMSCPKPHPLMISKFTNQTTRNKKFVLFWSRVELLVKCCQSYRGCCLKLIDSIARSSEGMYVFPLQLSGVDNDRITSFDVQ